MRWIPAVVLPALLLSACGTGIYVPDAGEYVRNPVRYLTLKQVVSVNQDWDTAIADLPCSAFTSRQGKWFISGSVVANGVLFKDGPITDPAAPAAIGRKLAQHIGPGC